MASIDNTVRNYRLKEGLSAETSGGLLICLEKENAKQFIQEMHDNGLEANYAGEVVKGTKQSFVLSDASIEDVVWRVGLWIGFEEIINIPILLYPLQWSWST